MHRDGWSFLKNSPHSIPQDNNFTDIPATHGFHFSMSESIGVSAILNEQCINEIKNSMITRAMNITVSGQSFCATLASSYYLHSHTYTHFGVVVCLGRNVKIFTKYTYTFMYTMFILCIFMTHFIHTGHLEIIIINSTILVIPEVQSNCVLAQRRSVHSLKCVR